MKVTSFSKGMSVLEVIIGAAIILVLTTAISGAWHSYIVATRISNEKTQAAILIDETADALQFLRDESWATKISGLLNDTTYYLSWATTTYTISTTPNTVQGLYVRKFTLSNIYRDVQDNIVSSGTNDNKTKKVTITVATNQASPEVSIQAEMLLHDVQNN